MINERSHAKLYPEKAVEELSPQLLLFTVIPYGSDAEHVPVVCLN